MRAGVMGATCPVPLRPAGSGNTIEEISAGLLLTPDRWKQIEELYHRASERGLEAMAGVDPEIRAEVEKLLAQDTTGKILDERAAELLAESKAYGVPLSDLSGQVVS